MSSSVPPHTRIEQSLDAHFLEVVEQTIIELEFKDHELKVSAKHSKTAYEWIENVKDWCASDEEITQHPTLFKHLETTNSLEATSNSASTKVYFTALEKALRAFLKDIRCRELRINDIAATFDLGIRRLKRYDGYNVIRFVYEKEPFFLMEVRNRDDKEGDPTLWVRYNSKTKAYEEVKACNFDLEKTVESCKEISKGILKPAHNVAEPKISVISSAVKVKVRPAINFESYQALSKNKTRAGAIVHIKTNHAQPANKALQISKNISFKNTTIPVDNNTITSREDEDDWDLVQDTVDFESDMVLL